MTLAPIAVVFRPIAGNVDHSAHRRNVSDFEALFSDVVVPSLPGFGFSSKPNEPI
jgi:hypothetical protein